MGEMANRGYSAVEIHEGPMTETTALLAPAARGQMGGLSPRPTLLSLSPVPAHRSPRPDSRRGSCASGDGDGSRRGSCAPGDGEGGRRASLTLGEATRARRRSVNTRRREWAVGKGELPRERSPTLAAPRRSAKNTRDLVRMEREGLGRRVSLSASRKTRVLCNSEMANRDSEVIANPAVTRTGSCDHQVKVEPPVVSVVSEDGVELFEEMGVPEPAGPRGITEPGNTTKQGPTEVASPGSCGTSMSFYSASLDSSRRTSLEPRASTSRAALEATPSVERMKSDVIIKLDHEDASYSAGDVVRGHIEVSLTNEVKVRDIVVRFNGVSRVSWDEQRTFTKGSATSISRKNTEVYLDQQYSVLRSKMKKRGSHASITSQHVQTATSGEGEERIIIIPAGSHVFPLEFPLPLDLPASFEGKWGQIKYWVKITLERPWKFDIEREKEFKVNAHVDLNLEPELVRPIGTLGEFEPGVICCRSGLVNVELKVTRRGFAPGENIPFTAEIENNSKQKMQDAKVALLQHVMYRIGDVSKKTTTAVTSLNKGEILPGETVTWERDSLLIPSLPPTSNKGMKVIHIKYTVSIRYSSWSDEYSLPVNIVLGTCGLRRSTINTYLALLGSATPRGTPRGTPCPSPRGSRVNLHQIGPALSLHIQGNSLDVPKIRAPRQSCPVLLGLPQESEHVRRGSGGASPRHPRKGGSLGGSRGNCRLISSSDENVESLQVPNFDSGNTSRRSSASSYRQRLDSVRETDAERV